MKPIPPSTPDSLSPKREASQKIVQVGQQYMQTGEIDKAIHTFQEAINVDPENGVAYFFLAKALYHAQSFEEASGLLDKADTLLSSSHDWKEEIVRLRLLIEQAKQKKEEEKKEEREGYY